MSGSADRIVVRRHEVGLENGWATLRATIETPDMPSRQLWYRVSVPEGWRVSESSDAFVPVPLFDAMRRRLPLHVEGDVSPTLLANLEEFQRFWTCWYPGRFTPVEIIAEHEREQPTGEAGAVTAFSGGVDSCFTVYRHATGRAGRQTQSLRAGVMVHGFDIPIEETAQFEAAANEAEAILATLDLPLVRVVTNVRPVEHAWDDLVGAAVASCLHLLQPNASVGLVAASYPYERLPLWGSDPVSDRLLSSAAFPIRHDGGGYSRDDKIEAIAQWPAALEHLRVCWASPQRNRNCGSCVKCVRTILAFRALGLGLPPCFDHDVIDAQIRALRRLDLHGRESLRILLDSVERTGSSGSWVRAVRALYYRNLLRDRLGELVASAPPATIRRGSAARRCARSRPPSRPPA